MESSSISSLCQTCFDTFCRFGGSQANQNQAKGKGKKTTATRRGMPSFKDHKLRHYCFRFEVYI